MDSRALAGLALVNRIPRGTGLAHTIDPPSQHGAIEFMPRRRDHSAVQMSAYGPAKVLSLKSVELADLGPRDVRIRTCAAAVNHTDLEIRAGHWPIAKAHPFPYTPGAEVVGHIAEVGAEVSEWVVQQGVITMMQGLGGVRAERPGGYAEFVTVDADALAAVPEGADLLGMAAIGLVGVTALQGLQRLGHLMGQRVLVTGAAGGLGSAAVGIARAMGASVCGVVSRAEQAHYVRHLGAEQVHVVGRGHQPVIEAGSVDAVLDVVGGPLFRHCVNALRPGGTLSLVGAVAGGAVVFDAWQLIRPVTLTGYSSEQLTGHDLRLAMVQIVEWLGQGALRPPEYQVMGLEEAAQAHRMLERGGVKGRVLLVP
jgi:NADPH2:quinone reductase